MISLINTIGLIAAMAILVLSIIGLRKTAMIWLAFLIIIGVVVVPTILGILAASHLGSIAR